MVLKHLNFEGTMKVRSAPTNRHAQSRSGLPDAPPDPFFVWLLHKAGLSADAYRPASLQRRLQACLRTLRCQNGEEAQYLLEQQPHLLNSALSSVLLGVTEFFRDPAVFDALRHYLPMLVPSDAPLRVWSAACSDGCELYTVAILLDELGILHRGQLLGTDCRSDAIARARAASYAVNQLRFLSPQLRDRSFIVRGKRIELREGLRESAAFDEADLLSRVEPGPWNVILWRNTAIYLVPQVAREIWQRLAESLAPGGLLVTGKAERPECSVPLRRLSNCLYRRV